MRILVVEDEKNMNRLISEAMKDEKYSVDSCFDGRDALDYALAVDYDVIILDVNLPKMDGFAVVEKLRTEGCISPVLFLTARDSIADKVAGLGAGGDYYLTKPFSFDELRAVVKVMARKYTGNKTDEYSIADLKVDTSARTVVRAGETIELTSKEFALLEYMIRNRGIALTREKLISDVWGYDFFGDDRTLDTHIKLLRKQLGPYADKITTLRGVGYRFEKE